jgi:hypothetical protein
MERHFRDRKLYHKGTKDFGRKENYMESGCEMQTRQQRLGNNLAKRKPGAETLPPTLMPPATPCDSSMQAAQL